VDCCWLVILASCGEDKLVKLWDVVKAECLQTYAHHTDKVQGVRWHKDEAAVLATGSFDRRLCIVDVRHQSPAATWTLATDVESLEWNPHAPDNLLVSTEDGVVACYSLSTGDKPIWRLQAHDKSVSAISISTGFNLMATVSVDKTFKLWDLTGSGPCFLESKETQLGKLFCGAFYDDSPHLLAVGGKKGMKVFNILPTIAARFPSATK